MGTASSGETWAMGVMAGGLALAGLWLLWTARRRRSGVRPYCAACDYALHGLPDGTTRCPECGGDIAAPGGVVEGRRRPDRALVLAGVVMVLPAVLSGTYLALQAIQAWRSGPRAVIVRTVTGPVQTPVAVPPNPFAQISDDELADAILATSAPGPVPATAQSTPLGVLLAEASARAKASADVPATQRHLPLDWVERLIDAGLRRQADPAQDWPEEWARFIESLWTTRHLSLDRWRQYLQTGVQVDATFRESMEAGAPFPYAYKTRVRVSPELAGQLKCRMLNLSLGEATTDHVLRHDPMPASRFESRSTYKVSFSKEAWQRVPPGQHVARLTILVAYQHPRFVNSTSDWIIRIEKPMTVLPRADGQIRYTPGVDEAVARSLRVSADPKGGAADGLRWDGGKVVLSLHCDNAPQDIYAQVSVSPGFGTGAYILGHVHWRKGESGVRELKGSFKELSASKGKTLDVVLIGSPANAAATLESGDWWHGTVRFDAVTLIDETAPAPQSLSTPERQVHRPGTKVRPYGYYPVEPTTQSATPPGGPQSQ